MCTISLNHQADSLKHLYFYMTQETGVSTVFRTDLSLPQYVSVAYEKSNKDTRISFFFANILNFCSVHASITGKSKRLYTELMLKDVLEEKHCTFWVANLKVTLIDGHLTQL